MGVENVADDIRSMKIRGAGRIARQAAEALMNLVDGYEGDGLDDLKNELEKGRETLLSSRPTAVSLWNGVQAVLKGYRKASTLDDLKDLVKENGELFIERSNRATEVIGEMGARRLNDGDRILTHCNSSVALSVIKTAFREGKNIEVFATESRPWRQGLITVRELSEEGVPVTLIVDSAVRWIMKDIDIVLVGADTISSNGAVINKIGTSQIALVAHEARVPFVVCAETYKFSPMTLTGKPVEIEERGSEEVARPGELPDTVKVLNPVFDATPPEYIDYIITEIGLIPPSASYEVIVRMLGHEFLFENEDW
ncbi:MAG: ribose 1,5-bisphosphate isomerase [Methanomassiliicoccales archaeon]|nr:ribose 1,5-bisphosphate isomerase [Methanomassiliicoccales archaeon]NYT14814.1 ribose 1,5-bisphosphate isomerase [Methanomassiliicoccales archaeon]